MIAWTSDQGISRVRLDAPHEALSLEFVSQDSRVLEVLELVRQVADTTATVLVTGESGTGKEFIARALHAESSRRRAPFLPVNCGAVASTLQDSEFFGHVRGAFSGATEHKVGKFPAADGGTLFLDEISEMDRSLQVKLLRILQYGEYAPVGAAENRRCDVRVVAATNRDLVPLVQTGAFRGDLYYRLNIIRLELPPLRERRDDIPVLAEHFLQKYGAVYGKPGLKLGPAFRDFLQSYDFPGNIRELENLIQRAVILCRRGPLACPSLPAPVPPAGRATAAPFPANFHEAKSRAVEEFERAYLQNVLSVCGGIVCRAARHAGLSERNLHEKLKKYGIRSQAFRGPHARPG